MKRISFFLFSFTSLMATSPISSPPFKVKITVDKTAQALLKQNKESVLIRASFGNSDASDAGGTPIELEEKVSAAGGVASFKSTGLGTGKTSTDQPIDTLSISIFSTREHQQMNLLNCSPMFELPIKDAQGKTFQSVCSTIK